MESDTHQGYRNYETFAVSLEIQNSQDHRQWAKQMTWNAVKSKTDREANITLADWLKNYYNENMPCLESPFSELLSAGLSEVDWLEIANELLEEIGEKL